jgi:hypothetical protein
MSAVSGAVLSLLRDAYQRRDKIGRRWNAGGMTGRGGRPIPSHPRSCRFGQGNLRGFGPSSRRGFPSSATAVPGGPQQRSCR